MEDALEDVWRSLKLTEEERDCIGTDGFQGVTKDREEQRWLVAKLLTRRPFNKDALLGTMSVIWRLSKDAKVVIMDTNSFLFKFANKKDRYRVLERAPWSFDKQLLAFNDYDGDLQVSDFVFNKTSLWVQMYGLPLKMMHHNIAEKIGSKLGVFQQVNDELIRSSWGNCLRIRVVS